MAAGRISWGPLSAVLVGLAIGGCSGSGGLTTGSFFGGASAPAAPKPEDPLAIPGQVGITSAKAAKCGFYFSPQKLRAQYLAAQVTQGAAPDQMQRLERVYDAAYARTTAALSGRDDFCTKPEVETIRADLNRHLAGDYTLAPAKPQQAEMTLWESMMSGGEHESKPSQVFTSEKGLPR
jgi:hypothetical protein